MLPIHATRAAPGSGWPSAAASPRRTAAGSGRSAPSRPAASSHSLFRSPTPWRPTRRRTFTWRWPMPTKHVLIIDDEESIREVAALTFELADWNVTCAASGVEGIAGAAAVGPDVIMLDVMMPDLD